MTWIAPKTSRLDRELRALVDDHVLSPDQAARLWGAAQADQSRPVEHSDDQGAARLRRTVERDRTVQQDEQQPASNTGVLDVVGYLGGALVLGALIFVGFTLWGDLSRAGKTALAVASFVVSAVGGLVLVRNRTRQALALTLLVLACVAAGFACNVIIDDDDLIITSAVVVVVAALGAVLLRSAAFYLPGWLGAMGFSVALVIAPSGLDIVDGDQRTYAITAGFLLVGLVLIGTGLVLGRDLAWVLAGLSGWAATVPVLASEHSYLALAISTVVAAALFVGAVRLRLYSFAVVGCLIVLSIWPIALYQILDTALGVALGLVAGGAVLITAAVLIARRRRQVRAGVSTG